MHASDDRYSWPVMAGDRYRLVSFPEGFFFEKRERKLGCNYRFAARVWDIFLGREETWFDLDEI